MSSTASTDPTVIPADAEPALAAALSEAAEAWAAGLKLPGEAVLYVRADMPTLEPRHAQAALEDLAEGCELSVGPSHDGGWYLLALARPHPEAVVDDLGEMLRIVTERRWPIGMLRGERRLLGPRDVPALLLDPRLPPRVRELLQAGG